MLIIYNYGSFISTKRYSMRSKSETETPFNPSSESIITINPTCLTPEQSLFLIDFLEGDESPEVYSKDTVYTFAQFKFKFTHELNWRHRKDGISECFEVIKDTRAGSGKFASVDNIEGKLIFKESGLEFIPVHLKPQKERVRKFIFFKKDKEEAQWRKSIKEEYKRTRQAGHLNIKEPVFYKDKNELYAYFFIKKAPGPTLHDLLYGDAKQPLDTATRKAISLAIINAYIDQVEMKGLVHNDLSLRNIMVDLSSPQRPRVTFIDFAFAKKVHKNDAGGVIRGTPLYMAPERFVGDGSSTASDVFALGHILAEIWGGQRVIPSARSGIRGIYLANKKGTFDSELIHVEASDREKIVGGLLQMISPNPEDRPVPEEVKDIFITSPQQLAEPTVAGSMNYPS